jgi:hypothetical protein
MLEIERERERERDCSSVFDTQSRKKGRTKEREEKALQICTIRLSSSNFHEGMK